MPGEDSRGLFRPRRERPVVVIERAAAVPAVKDREIVAHSLSAHVGINGNQMAAVGGLSKAKAATEVDAKGLAVTPGFIDMLSDSELSLIADYRSLGELRQGATTQIFDESSAGPLNDETERNRLSTQGEIKSRVPG